MEGATAFYDALASGCPLSDSGSEYVLNLTRNVVPEQRWGLGEAGFDPSWSVGMKGGWGPEAGSGAYLVRQSGVAIRILRNRCDDDGSGRFVRSWSQGLDSARKLVGRHLYRALAHRLAARTAAQTPKPMPVDLHVTMLPVVVSLGAQGRHQLTMERRTEALGMANYIVNSNVEPTP